MVRSSPRFSRQTWRRSSCAATGPATLAWVLGRCRRTRRPPLLASSGIGSVCLRLRSSSDAPTDAALLISAVRPTIRGDSDALRCTASSVYSCCPTHLLCFCASGLSKWRVWRSWVCALWCRPTRHAPRCELKENNYFVPPSLVLVNPFQESVIRLQTSYAKRLRRTLEWNSRHR